VRGLGRYPEKALQDVMTSWLLSQWGYEEAFDDAEALGARFDSVGRIGQQLVLIEYKVAVGTNIVRHRADRAMSLESKIAGGLRSIYDRASDALSECANRVWDRESPPLVVVAAASFSTEALVELRCLFEARSAEWRFDYAVWRWTGSGVEELIRGQTGEQWTPNQVVALPLLIGRTERGAPRTVEELSVLAETDLERCLIEQFCAVASARGLTLKRARTSVAIQARVGGKLRSVLAAYPGRSGTGGLNVGVDLESFGRSNELGELEAAPPAGFLNANFVLMSTSDLEYLFRTLWP
jgi:hypothetical protein